MRIEENLLYTKDHEWVRVDGDKAYVGITDFAQDSLGDIVFLDMPDEEDEASKGEVIVSVESVKAASDVFSPVNGEVVEINEDLADEPGKVNEEPYESWMVAIKIEDKSELDNLLSKEDYEKLCKEEA